MTTFSTYQEAKIANPDKDILTDSERSLFTPECKGLIGDICNPAEFCMTVEKFLLDGHKFVEGDLVYSSIINSVCRITDGSDLSGNTYALKGSNELAGSDDRRYTLRAKALEDLEQEDKPKRTKMIYENANFSKEWEAVRHYNDIGELFIIDHGEYKNVNELDYDWYVVVCKNYRILFVQKEIEISESEFVIDIFGDGQDSPYFELNGDSMVIDGGITIKQMRAIADALDDSGRFKLAD